MKFALLLLSTSLNLSIAADATRAVTARALETAEEKKTGAEKERVRFVPVKELEAKKDDLKAEVEWLQREIAD